MSNKYLPPSGALAASCISQIRGCKNNQSCTATSPNQSLRGQETFYINQAAIPNNTTGNSTSISEFYDASILTANVTTTPESTSTYNNCNNGSIISTLQCESVVTAGNGDKVYNFKFGTGVWIEKSENISNPNSSCRTATCGNRSSGAYTVSFQDGLNNASKQPVVTGSVVVNYGSGNRTAVIQR